MKDLEIEGYATEIHRGLWERITSFGAPRLWAACWTVFCAFVAIQLLFRGQTKLMFLPMGLWPVGHGILVLLTNWDRQFDDVLLVSPRYKDHYEAG
jgi:type IV secretory pathway TrbD component